MQFSCRLVRSRGGAVDGTVPAVVFEALGADLGHVGVGTLQRATQDSTTHAGRPVLVHGAVTLRHNILTVKDEEIPVGVVVRRVMKGRHVGVEDVRRVGEVDDQGSDITGAAGGVGAVAAKEGGSFVEAHVDKGVGVRDGREGSTVGNARRVQGTLVGGNQRSTVRPGAVGVSGRVNGKDDIHVSLGLDQRVQRDVLEILTTVHDIKLPVGGVRGRVVAPSVEGVGGVDGDIVRVLTNVAQDVGKDILEPARQRGAVDIQEELVEQTGGGTHDEAAIVKSADAGLVVRQASTHEAGTQVLGRDKTEDGGVEGAEFPRVDFKHRGVAADDQLTWITTICHQDGQRHVTLLEVVGQGDGRPSLARASLGVIDKLVGQSTAPTFVSNLLWRKGMEHLPVVRNRSREASIRLGRDFIVDILPVADGIKELNTTGVRSLQNRVFKLPNSTILVRLQIGNAGKVVDVDGANQPPTTTETGNVGGRLQQSTQLARGSRVLRPTIKGLDGTGAVQHGPITTARHCNTNVGQIGRVALDAVDVPSGVEVVDGNMTKEILQGGRGLVAPGI